MKAARTQVQEMLVEMGYAGAAKWNDEKLQARIAGIADDDKPESDDAANLYTNLVKAVAAEEEVELIDSDAPAAKSKKLSKGKKGKGKDAKKTRSAAKREAAELDKFGSRVGTTNAKIHAAMSTQFMSIPEILAKAKVESVRYAHFKDLVKAGHAKTNKEGQYALKK